MHIDQFNECPELSAYRKTKFYTVLRPYVHGRVKPFATSKNYQIRQEDEHEFTALEKYFAKLDILFGQVFRNIQMRQYWKSLLVQLGDSDHVSVLAFTSLHRAYVNDLVTLFERLSSFPALFEKVFGPEFEIADLEQKLLVFFNPLVFDKRNYDQHQLYLGFPGYGPLAVLEERALKDSAVIDEYYALFLKILQETVEWIDYSEQEIASFLRGYLDAIDDRIRSDDQYLEPTCLPDSFSLADKLNANLRRKYRHTEVFEE